MKNKFNKLINSNEMYNVLFSLKGVLNRPAFAMGMCTAYFGLLIIKSFAVPVLAYIVGLLLFYPVLLVIQKRCRDFNCKGTLFILAYTFLIVSMSAEYFVYDKNMLPFYEYVRYAQAIMTAIVMLLFFIPGKKDKDENLCSPLLKYPLLYAVVCCILAVTATLTVSYYTGTEIKLF